MMATIDERYLIATRASSLVFDTKVDGNALDVLTAAGWCRRNSLGVLLHRVRSEWDIGAGEYKRALRALGEAETVLRRAKDDDARAAAARELESARGNAATERVLLWAHLRTLREVKTALAAMALRMATRERIQDSDQKLMEMSSHALRMWLESRCSRCGGRGFTGHHLGNRLWCDACGATGVSDYHLRSAGDRRSWFVRKMLSEMDRKCHRVDQYMRRLLRRWGPSYQVDPASLAEMLERLWVYRKADLEDAPA